MSELSDRLNEQTAANQKALNYRAANANAARAARQPGKRRPTDSNATTAKKRKVAIQQETIGFRFYFTSSFVETTSFASDRNQPVLQLKSDYDSLVSRYGDGWSTNIIQLDRLPSYLERTGFRFGVLGPNISPVGARELSRLDQLDVGRFPEIRDAPFDEMQFSVVPPTLITTFQEENTRGTTLLDGFDDDPEEVLAQGNVVICYDEAIWWDVPGWPYQGGGSQFPDLIRTGGTGIYETITWQMPYDLIYVTCSPSESYPTECKYLTTIGFLGYGGYYRVRWRTADGEIVDQPGFDTFTYQELTSFTPVNTTYYLPRWSNTADAWLGPPVTIQTFRSPMVRTCAAASSSGAIVLLYRFDDYTALGANSDLYGDLSTRRQGLYKGVSGVEQSKADAIFDLVELGVNALDLSFNLSEPYSSGSSSLRGRYVEWVALQHPVALRIEGLLNTESNFLTIIQGEWSGPETIMENYLRVFLRFSYQRESPYAQLRRFLRLLESASALDPNAEAQRLDAVLATTDLTMTQRQQAVDIQRVRYKALIVATEAYLGSEAVAYAKNPSAFASFPGRLQLDD